MNKIGILTFHYSNNYGGVLQCFSLYKVLQDKGYNVEVINYIPKEYKKINIISELSNIKKDIFKLKKVIKKLNIKIKYSKNITKKFDEFRNNNIKLSKEVNEETIVDILNQYDLIIVGSDQVWNPLQRLRKEYFLDYGDLFKGKKISYAADSTNSIINDNDLNNLRKSLKEFDYITVRNEHTKIFVKRILGIEVKIVADPTLLYDFSNEIRKQGCKEKYILTYILGKELKGSNLKAINKIKEKYGNIKVYSIEIPNSNNEINNYADKIFYTLNPIEWLEMFKNATFVYTDSFHGVLFSLKFKRPFLAYYTEVLRASRFIDLGKRYNIDNYIISDIHDLKCKKSLEKKIDFETIDTLMKNQKLESINLLDNTLKNFL